VEQLSKQSDTDSNRSEFDNQPIDVQSTTSKPSMMENISEQVISAQRVFKRFGKRLDIFSRILQEQPPAKQAAKTASKSAAN